MMYNFRKIPGNDKEPKRFNYMNVMFLDQMLKDFE